MKKCALLISCLLLLQSGAAMAQYVDDSVYGNSDPYGGSNPYNTDNQPANANNSGNSDDMYMSDRQKEIKAQEEARIKAEVEAQEKARLAEEARLKAEAKAKAEQKAKEEALAKEKRHNNRFLTASITTGIVGGTAGAVTGTVLMLKAASYCRQSNDRNLRLNQVEVNKLGTRSRNLEIGAWIGYGISAAAVVSAVALGVKHNLNKKTIKEQKVQVTPVVLNDGAMFSLYGRW